MHLVKKICKQWSCITYFNFVWVRHNIFINDDESGLHHDYEVWLEKLAPHAPVEQYRHNGYEDNADAHMKRQIMGREVVVAITDGKLDFGTWEQIFYGEFDGRRKKRVLVKIIGEWESSIMGRRRVFWLFLYQVSGKEALKFYESRFHSIYLCLLLDNDIVESFNGSILIFKLLLQYL